MISIFVSSNDKGGEPIVASHFEFVAVPRTGDEILVDEAGRQLHLKVAAVTHEASPKGDFMNPVSHIRLSCEYLGGLE